MSDELYAERTPDGGIRLKGVGIDIQISKEALERANEADGLGLNYELTELLYDKLPPFGIDAPDCPFDESIRLFVQVQPRGENQSDSA